MFGPKRFFSYGFLVVLLLISQLGLADTFSAGTSAFTFVSGTLIFDSNGQVSANGIWSNSSPLAISFPGISLPSGAMLTSAFLELSVSPGGSASAIISRYENNYPYTVRHCSWFSCHYYTYYGVGGNAEINANYGTYISSITAAHAGAPGSGSGTYDLLAMGFGYDLLAGNPISVNGQTYINASYGISYLGYSSSTYYQMGSGYTGTINGMLTVNYALPAELPNEAIPIPEPASMLLLGAGLGIAGVLRRAVR